MQFTDRLDAGRRLAEKLAHLRGASPLVLGLPRGGVPVANEVARALGAPLDVWCVRKLGAPGFPELGMGAVAEGGTVFIDPRIVDEVGASPREVDQLVANKTWEVEERAARFRGGKPPPEVSGRTVIVVDDGIATGGTCRAALQALRAKGAGRLVLAVPVAATQSLEALRPFADEVVCVFDTPNLYAIGAWYDDFTQVDDEEVVRLLREASPAPAPAPVAKERARRAAADPEVAIAIGGGRTLEGSLNVPEGAIGLVLFAHGSGSSRFSRRNQYVAGVLRERKIATLLFDLLTADEEREDEITREFRFDIGLLAERLDAATRWASQTAQVSQLPLGYFGASTGAAAALISASRWPEAVGAVVSRGGRPDLADESLPAVRAPTLLIVGGEDREVLALNRQAAARLTAPHRITIVPRATHLFEEPGTLEVVAHAAGDWFEQCFHGAGGTKVPRAA